MSILKCERAISHDDLKKAISLRCANCFAAMQFANALGGTQTDAWYLCHNYTLKQMVDEANSIGLDLTNLESAIDKKPVKETLYYKRATGLMTEQEFQTAFRKWQKGE